MMRALATSLAAVSALSLAGCKPKPARLEVNPPSITFHSPGGTALLRVTARDKNGAPVPLQDPCTFVSSNPAVADARQDATARGLANGTAELRVACGALSAAVPVQVRMPVKVALTLDCAAPACALKSQEPLAFRLEGQGASAHVKAMALDDQGGEVPAEVRFEVADAELQAGTRKPGIAISPLGEVRAVGVGRYLLLAQAGDALAKVEVEALLPPVDVVQAPRSIALKPGAEATITAKAFRRSRRGLVLVPGSRFAFSTSNAAIAKVSDDGRVVAVSPGTAEVVVAAETGSPSPAFAQVAVRVGAQGAPAALPHKLAAASKTAAKGERQKAKPPSAKRRSP
jgi:hypothetical protein